MYGQVLLRVLISFLMLFVLARLTGKKEMAKLTFFDFITAVAAGDLSVNFMIDPENPIGPYAAGLALWFSLAIGFDFFLIKWRRAAKLLEGEPTVLIHKGKILEDKLAGVSLRVDDMLALIRQKGHFDPREIEYAILETDGSLSVLPKSTSRPVQPGDLGLAPVSSGMSSEIIVEGQLFSRNLHRLGRDEAWLRQQLAAHGIQDLSEVFYCSLNERGELYMDRYKDHIKVAIDISDYPGPN